MCPIIEVKDVDIMDLDTLLTLSITILLALIGYIATYFNNLRIEQRKDRLERVNRQLREYYGPLFALVRASATIFFAFRDRYCKRDEDWGELTPEELAAWQAWMSEVFMPLNLRMEKIIVENADLMDEPEMPDCLLTLSAHVYAYKIVLMKWESGDTSELSTGIPFPQEELMNYIDSAYIRLKAEQTELLGK